MRHAFDGVWLLAAWGALTAEANTPASRFVLAALAAAYLLGLGLLWRRGTRRQPTDRAPGRTGGHSSRGDPRRRRPAHSRSEHPRATKDGRGRGGVRREERERRQALPSRRLVERRGTFRQFATGLGRELNDPVSVILGNVDHVRQRLATLPQGPSPEQRQELLDVLQETRDVTERLQDMAADLELLSAPTDLERGPVDVVATLRCAAEAVAYTRPGPTLLVEEFQEVPLVSGHMRQLYQVFHHLLTHVTRLSRGAPAAQREVRLRVRMGEASHILVEVSGSGCLIPTQDLGQAFQPFSTPSGAERSSGLGLSVCHDLVTALGGAISVESQGSQTSTFQVRLPRYEAPWSGTRPQAHGQS